jgi:HEPN domain-containing protein
MNALDHARALMRVAARDFDALKAMCDNTAFADEVVGFHAQQAIEKSLKAWISALGGTYPFTRDIAQLLRALDDLGQDVSGFDELARYTDFAVQFRYEEIICPEDALDRAAALADVHALFGHVKAAIP